MRLTYAPGVITGVMGIFSIAVGLIISVWKGDLDVTINFLYGGVLSAIGVGAVGVSYGMCAEHKVAKLSTRCALLENRIDWLEDKISPEYSRCEDSKEWEAINGRDTEKSDT